MLSRAGGFSRLVAAALFLTCKLLIVNWAFLSTIKMKQPYWESPSESVSPHMEIFMHQSKLIIFFSMCEIEQCHS